MTISAMDEQAKTLAMALGIDEEEAADILDVHVVVRGSRDALARATCQYVVDLLGRTVGMVGGERCGRPAVEVVVGDATPVCDAPAVRVGIAARHVTISSDGSRPDHEPHATISPIFLAIAACYAAGMAVRIAAGSSFPFPFSETIRVPVDLMLRGHSASSLTGVDLGKVYMAGAGAIGNGLLHGLTTLSPRGELHVVDPKKVSAGNLGRCSLFLPDDIGHPKAVRLVQRAQEAMPRLTLVPRVDVLQDLPERGDGAWLERLVVAVDSRRARRGLQEELPRDVYDASTTGIEEIVLSFNSATEDGACLSCIYPVDHVECAHEAHVARMLGVSLSHVREQFISEDAARLIVLRHPDLDPRDLVTTAYDSLFKARCATGQLGIAAGRTVLAPFPFVSTLAGAYLAIELVMRSQDGAVAKPFNYWRASPWTAPIFQLRARRAKRAACPTCGNGLIRATVSSLWGACGTETQKEGVLEAG